LLDGACLIRQDIEYRHFDVSHPMVAKPNWFRTKTDELEPVEEVSRRLLDFRLSSLGRCEIAKEEKMLRLFFPPACAEGIFSMSSFSVVQTVGLPRARPVVLMARRYQKG
jgi:hypothetical protein